MSFARALCCARPRLFLGGPGGACASQVASGPQLQLIIFAALCLTVFPLPCHRCQAAKCDQSSEKSRKAVLEYTRPATALFAPSPAEYNAFEVKFPDVMEQSRLWAWGGISFGDETTYLLHLGCRSLAIEHKCRVRFWGKVATRSGDYFIAEANTKVRQ